MVLVGGMGSLWGSVFGVILLSLLPEVLHGVKEYNVLVYGFILMTVLMFFPKGAVSGHQILWQRGFPEKDITAPVLEKKDAAVLDARKITVRFEDLEALSRLSFSIDLQRIVSIIGPNGAGKTTLLNAITGVDPLHAGEILFQGKSITGLKPFQIAALGITRSFQQAQLFMNMTVLEKVMVGMHSRTTAGVIKGMLRPPSERREEVMIREKSQGILSEFGLLSKAGDMAGHICILDQRRL